MAVLYRVRFGFRCGPHGDEPIYMQKTTFRCEDHTDSDKCGFISAVPVTQQQIKDFERQMAGLNND